MMNFARQHEAEDDKDRSQDSISFQTDKWQQLLILVDVMCVQSTKYYQAL